MKDLERDIKTLYALYNVPHSPVTNESSHIVRNTQQKGPRD